MGTEAGMRLNPPCPLLAFIASPRPFGRLNDRFKPEIMGNGTRPDVPSRS